MQSKDPIRSETTDALFDAILTLETREECYHFFEDLCTVKEIQDMSQRLETAALLLKGLSYQKIGEQVNISSATIGRVNKCINYGSGGYKLAIERLGKGSEEDDDQ